MDLETLDHLSDCAWGAGFYGVSLASVLCDLIRALGPLTAEQQFAVAKGHATGVEDRASFESDMRAKADAAVPAGEIPF